MNSGLVTAFSQGSLLVREKASAVKILMNIQTSFQAEKFSSFAFLTAGLKKKSLLWKRLPRAAARHQGVSAAVSEI